MRRILESTAVEAALLVALSIFVLSGIERVPFHPDEASLLYQSRDLEQLLTDPLDMAWEPSAAPSPEMTYRLLNAPLPKYVLGLGRSAAGFGPQAVAVDWDWSKTWIENAMLGALPGPRVLEAARTASATALLVGVAALYLATRRLAGRGAAIAAAVFLGINALALLHGRRAMAEGTLMMGVGIALLGILSADRKPFLAGLAVAVAVASKTSTLPLLLIGWLAALWWPGGRKINITAAARVTLLYASGFVVLTLALHPVLWRHPILAARKMVEERNELLARQVADIQMLAPDHVLSSVPQRSVVLVANLYLAPLQYAEVGNYLEELGSSIEQYQAAFGRDLLRSSAGGGFLLGLTLLGLAWGWRRARRTDGDRGRAFVVLLLATIAQASALVIAIPLPVQRYMLPLLPLVCLWQGVGVAGGIAGPTTKRRPEVRAA